jgi:hypothetical protein
MVRKGSVIRLSHQDNSGVILDDKGREFYFHANECEGDILPPLDAKVTFVKDTDFKSTNVASLVKRIASKITPRPVDYSEFNCFEDFDEIVEMLQRKFQ